MALSALMDLMTMTIPNAIPLALGLGYFASAAALGVTPETVAFGLSCGLAMLAITFLMFCRDWIGGGDAKLAAAIALWMGWGAILDYAVSASICGGVLTLAILAVRAQPLPAALARQSVDRRGCAIPAPACPTELRWRRQGRSSSRTARSGAPQSSESGGPIVRCRLASRSVFRSLRQAYRFRSGMT